MILLIDNYDSFSYNLYQLIGSVEPDIKVVRNDEIEVSQIEELNPLAIILSPGPGKPKDAGICPQVIKTYAGRIPIFGVCLGHQAICEAFGATVGYAQELMHGKTSLVRLDTKSRMFYGMNETMQVARYHSLAAVPQTIPKELKITAVTDKGEIMAVEHETKHVYGVQFHPESVMTPDGIQIIRNFIKIAKEQRTND
ncbi:MAG: anthranilate synthase component II [Lachnospiraceae bacterium]